MEDLDKIENTHIEPLEDEKNDDFSFLTGLLLKEELVSIIHLNKQLIELIFAPLETNESIIDEKFEFHFQGNKYSCYYDIATDVLKTFANAFREEKDYSKSTRSNNRKQAGGVSLQEDEPGRHYARPCKGLLSASNPSKIRRYAPG